MWVRAGLLDEAIAAAEPASAGPTLDSDKLAKVLGMLGSAHPGEVAVAGTAAHKMITEVGLRWPDLIKNAKGKPR